MECTPSRRILPKIRSALESALANLAIVDKDVLLFSVRSWTDQI